MRINTKYAPKKVADDQALSCVTGSSLTDEQMLELYRYLKLTRLVEERIVCEQAETWNLKKITKPHLQHGTYSFFFWDADDNCWEILTNPEGGYSWLFEQGDQEGKGHLDRNFKRPGVTA